MPDIRAELKRLMAATVADHENWTYAEVRPLAVPPSWQPGQEVRSDCSKGVQYLCKWAGAPDPMGNDFADWGNSTTIAAHLQHLSRPEELLVGDPVTFGLDGSEHAALTYEEGDDPLLWSDGHQGAPNFYRLSQDGREAQYLRLPVPVYVPSPDDLLRAEMGYWAWLQWQLGEGEWKGRGKRAKGVRPDVPRRIPLRWWKRRATFVLRRKKGNPPSTPAAR